MSCASCAAHVTKALKGVEGVSEANVNLATASAKVTFNEAVCSPQLLKAAVERMGFELDITPPASNTDTTRAETVAPLPQVPLWQMKRTALGALVVALLLFLLGTLPRLFSGQEVAAFFLATFSLWKYGRVFYASAWRLLKHGTSNMDTLVALSITVSYAYSFFNLFFPQWFTAHGMQPQLYFDSVGVITAFILLGRWLEARAKQRTTDSVRRLMGLQPKEVTVVFPNGTLRVKPISEVQPGDVLLAKPGERIAADGVVMSGSSNVDESMLSGEPVAVIKVAGNKVMAGTINKQGTLQYKAVKAQTDTLLSHIIAMVQEAQGSKVPVQNLVDRIAAVFVPTIIGIALLTLVCWLLLSPENGLTHGLIAMVSVLVIACPCSLGLATPTAIIVGVGSGAEKGILIKDATCLEVAQGIDTVVLDKTGTITEGRPEVVQTWFGGDEAQLSSVLLAIERLSEHPLAEAVCNHFKNAAPLTAQHFTTHVGTGAKAEVSGRTYWVGSSALMREKNITFTAEAEARLKTFEQNAYTVVALADNTNLLALLAVTDRIKPSSTAAIAQLHAMHISTIVLTGDNEATAAVVAQQVGADGYRARLLPADKAAYIKQLQNNGHRVAMVGDGINDSAALATANLSVAMGRGSDIAISTAMLTLLTNDLCRLPDALRLSARTVRTIRQNLFWAFFYNIISVPVAAGVLYPLFGVMLNPMVAGAAMALSSVSVVTNSLRQFRK